MGGCPLPVLRRVNSFSSAVKSFLFTHSPLSPSSLCTLYPFFYINIILENIEKISVVAGEYDIVIRVRVKSLGNLLKVTDKIQLIEGVKKTTTQVIEKELAL